MVSFKYSCVFCKNCYNHSAELSANITASELSDEGSFYTLTCAVHGDESLAATNRTFLWERVDSMDDMLQVPTANDTLTFYPLSRDNAGEYRCNASFDSPYLIGTRSVISQSVTITVMSKCTLDDRCVQLECLLAMII